ncbi:7989_t:CDS:2 [Racocetra persica]|uniref:7989_t:CDS:1 n=1 Tax=Racocetra persica TaxID=160502 RepID=A0ACA9KN10_9GLOM|nr:7989_t:CDS:2 [Racocetra persica]
MVKDLKKRTCQFYIVQEKVSIVRYTLCKGNIKVTIKFSLDKSQVGYWVIQLKDKLTEIEYSKSYHLKAEIDPKIIQCAFHKYSISNTIDRSKDDEIYHDKIFCSKTYKVNTEIHNILNEQDKNIIKIDSSKYDKDQEYYVENQKHHNIVVKENNDVLVFTSE